MYSRLFLKLGNVASLGQVMDIKLGLVLENVLKHFCVVHC